MTEKHQHAWVPAKSLSGLTHLQQCSCGGRRISGVPIYVNSDGQLIRMFRKPVEDLEPTEPVADDEFDPGDL
jgi:hypothetical protein